MAALPARSGILETDGTRRRQHLLHGRPGALPPPEIQEGQYELDYARCPEDIEAIQRLRFDVFNLELDEGLDTSLSTGLDKDEFDDTCDHLFVRHRESGRMIGTYRMQTREHAQTGQGFYAATEFDLKGLPDQVLEEAVEIGRACIHRDHRSLKVLYMLWKGLGRYASFHQKRYLFGCCSLSSQNPQEAWDVHRQLEAAGHLHPEWTVRPLSSHACEQGHQSTEATCMPRLMRTYLSLGASICSGPAIDREFKTIDFLAIFDFKTLKNSDLAFYRFRS